MADWYVDPGLARFITQWRGLHPFSTVWTIGDPAHQATISDHNPEADGSVDAADVMPGTGVDQQDLDDLAEVLRVNRDPRIKYVIRRQRIFFGPDGPQPFTWRPYTGDYHGHVHLSVGDAHEGKPATAWDLTAPEGEEMPTLQEIQTAVWSAESAEYFDADGDGVRQKRTRVDILHRAEAAAQRAEDAALRAVADAAEIRAMLTQVLERLPAPPVDPPVEP
jgi:hypothetical protein